VAQAGVQVVLDAANLNWTGDLDMFDTIEICPQTTLHRW
jgi:hypothetical protein